MKARVSFKGHELHGKIVEVIRLFQLPALDRIGPTYEVERNGITCVLAGNQLRMLVDGA